MVDRKNLEQSLRQIKSDRAHLEEEIARLQELLAKLQPVEDHLTALINSLPETPPKPQRQSKAKASRQHQTDISQSISDRILQEVKNAGVGGLTVPQIKQSLSGIKESIFHSALRDLRDRSQIRNQNGVYYVPNGKPDGAPV
jgi:ribosomal protein S25